jgi:outer membrane murein-binding lipoprotein Lpp
MTRNFTLTGMLKVFSAIGLIFLMGCANTKQISSLEERVSNTDAELTQLKTDISLLNEKMTQLDSQVSENNSDLASLETRLNANTRETYLRVNFPILNIRTTPTTTDNNVIAKAEEGAYLRKIAVADEDNQWTKVEFMIDDYPYIGYVFNDEEFFKEEIYDPITFGRIYNRKLIKYQWETEAALEMKSNDFKILGVYIKVESPYRAERFLGYLAKTFRDHKIYIKPIESFNINQVPQQCNTSNVEGIMAVEIGTPVGFAPQMDIKLFDKGSVILYSAVLPLQSIELPDNIGRR